MMQSTYVRVDSESEAGKESVLIMGKHVDILISERDGVLVQGCKREPWHFGFGEIKLMEVSYDIAYAMEQALKDVPFQVVCPQNEEYQKAVDEVSSEDIVEKR